MRTDLRNYIHASLLIVIVSLVGCASSRHNNSDPATARPTSMIYSPNGEPLNGGTLGRPTCKEAMSGWFDRVDTNHDGMLSHEEFMVDAQIQFNRMDIDHRGYLVPEELERFRLPYRQDETTLVYASNQSSDSGQSSGRHRHSRGGGDNSNSGSSGQSGSSGIPDPVMSADTNNDFRVTLDEFMAQAARAFSQHDTNRVGFIARDKIIKICSSRDK